MPRLGVGVPACVVLGGFLLGACSGDKLKVVGTCDMLPAPGEWEDVTPPGTSSKPAVNATVGAAIIVDPFDPRRVWLGTGGENDEIWRSDDCGATWTRANTGPGGVGDGKTFGGVGDGAQWSMQADVSAPGVLYAVSGCAPEGWVEGGGLILYASMFSGGVARLVVPQ